MIERDNGTAEYETVISRLRGLPRYEPGVRYRMKMRLLMGWYAFFRNLRHRPCRTSRRKPKKPVLAGLAVVATMLFLLVASFYGLSQVADGSVPGNALYWLDRFEENVVLALRREPSGKASVRLDQASERLAEIEELESRDSLGPDALDELTADVEEGLRDSREYMGSSGMEPGEEERLTSRLNEVLAHKEELFASIERESVASLREIPARDVSVTLNDTAVNSLFDGSRRDLELTSDNNGEVDFVYHVLSPSEPVQIEASVEGPELRTVLPVETTELTRLRPPSYDAKVIPPIDHIPCFCGQEFVVQLTDSSTGRPADNLEVTLEDSSGTSLLNDELGPIEVETDRNGRLSFSFLKISTDRVSRVSLTVSGAVDEELGDILTVGASETRRDDCCRFRVLESPTDWFDGLVLDCGKLWIEPARETGELLAGAGTERSGALLDQLLLDVESLERATGLKLKGPAGTEVLLADDGCPTLARTMAFGGSADDVLFASTRIIPLKDTPYVLVKLTLENEGEEAIEINADRGGLSLFRAYLPDAESVLMGGLHQPIYWCNRVVSADEGESWSEVFTDESGDPVVSFGKATPSETDIYSWNLEDRDGIPSLGISFVPLDIGAGDKLSFSVYIGFDGHRQSAIHSPVIPDVGEGIAPDLDGPSVTDMVLSGYRIRATPQDILESDGRVTLQVLEPPVSEKD